MKERRTAVWVLSALVLIAIGIYYVLPGRPIIYKKDTLTYKNCTIKFEYDEPGYDSEILRINRNKLALCLCQLYDRQPDTAIAQKIVNTYQLQGNAIRDQDSLQTKQLKPTLKNLLKYRYSAFDTIKVIECGGG